MGRNLNLHNTDIEKQVEEKCAKGLFAIGGATSAAVKRLSDNTHDWVGSIFCEFIRGVDVSEEKVREVMHTAATNIQFILPEYK